MFVKALAGLALAALAVPAVAQAGTDDITVAPQAGTRQVAVVAGDLNLADARGRATLERRLASAASEACQADLQLNSAAAADVRRCREDALAGAHRQLEELRTSGAVAVGAS